MTLIYLPMDCPVCGRHRVEWDGKVLRCEKCTTSSEWDGFTSERYSARSTPAEPLDVSSEVYTDRNLVAQAFAQMMEEAGWPVWWGTDESEPDWPVLYINGPTGQVSWHIPKAERIYEPPIRPEHEPKEWDGHTTAEKFDRLRARLRSP